jgi:hypothetical protein
VLAINSVLAGVFAGMLSRFAFSLPIYATAGFGIAIFVTSLVMHHRYQLNKFTKVGSRLKALFPGDSK